MQFDLAVSTATRGSFADDVPCAIGTATATSANANRSHGITARLMFFLPLRPSGRAGSTRFEDACQERGAPSGSELRRPLRVEEAGVVRARVEERRCDVYDALGVAGGVELPLDVAPREIA